MGKSRRSSRKFHGKFNYCKCDLQKDSRRQITPLKVRTFKMKVIVIGVRGFPGVQGGGEKHSEELYSRLAKKKDLDITVIAIEKYKIFTEWEHIKFKYFKSIRSKSFEKLYYGIKASIFAILKRPDIIHFQGLNCAIYIPFIKLFGIKVVFTPHARDYLQPKWGTFAKFILRLSERAGLKADTIITVSDVINSHFKKYTNKSVVIHNGVNYNYPEIPESEEKHFLGKYGLEKNSYIFFAGRFTEEKAIEDLIEAYSQLDNKKFKLVIAGDADHECSYSQMIKNSVKNSAGIILTGSITGRELQVLFSNAKLFVLPSRYEGLSIALLEALSYGIEVLASDIEANLQINLNKNNYFKQGDIEDLKRKMFYHLNTTLTEETKNKRLQMIKDEYNWDLIAEKTYKIYQEILCT